jgi:hypothetical protein
MDISDPVVEDDIPIFPVYDSDIKAAQEAAARWLAETYHLQHVQGKEYMLVKRTHQGYEALYQPGELEVRGFAASLRAPAFQKVKFDRQIPLTPPLLIQSTFDNRWIGSFYAAYMRSHPVWKNLVWDDNRDGLGFENTEEPLPPLQHVPSLATAVTRAYRRWHHIRAVDDERKCTPGYYWQHAFITGQNPAGLIKVISLFDKPIARPSPDEGVLFSAYMNILRVMGAKQNIPIPTLEPPRHVGQDMSKSGGCNLYKTGQLELDNVIFKFVLQAAKVDSQMAGDVEFKCVVDQIRRTFNDDPVASHHYVGNILRKIVTVMFPKPEIGDPWRDPTKARLIFIVPYFKFAVDKLLFRPVLDKTHGIPPIGIGWSKTRGGLQFIYEHLVQYIVRDRAAGDGRKWFYVDGDFEKLDFSLAAGILTLVGMIPFWFYATETTDPVDYEIFRFLNEWSTDDLVSKFLHLFSGEDRLVIGMMFSGSLLTSWGDTCYVWLAFEMWYIKVAKKLRRRDPANYAHWQTIWPMALFIYGDDFIGCFPEYVRPYYESRPGDRDNADFHPGPYRFQRYIRRVANLGLKLSECNSYDTIATEISTMGDIIRPGPKFLQRRFVYAEPPAGVFKRSIGPYPRGFAVYRETSAYYTRASTLAGGNTLGQYVLKLRGLAEDTCGANWEAYQFLRTLHDSILAHPDFGPVAKEQLVAYAESIRNGGEIPKELLKRIKGSDTSIWRLLKTFPRWNKLQAKYWPTEAGVLMAKEKAGSTGFYYL